MKKYDVELSNRFKREFRKLDKYTQRIIRGWIDKNIVGTSDPIAHGKGRQLIERGSGVTE